MYMYMHIYIYINTCAWVCLSVCGCVSALIYLSMY